MKTIENYWFEIIAIAVCAASIVYSVVMLIKIW